MSLLFNNLEKRKEEEAKIRTQIFLQLIKVKTFTYNNIAFIWVYY